MSLKDVLPGKYNAKAIKGAWGKSKLKETPCVAVMFEFTNNGTKENIWWTGYLTDATIHRTFETLARIGYKETKPLERDENNNPIFTKEHLADKEVSIVIDVDEYEGKKQLRVKWINDLGGSKMAGLEVEKVLGNINLKSEMESARARLGIVAPKLELVQKDELPF